ncbi:hypothetical protein EDD22DRAFT_1019213 [Suillus occidentalis]|nr:hypothetical protein EDD22DRAFT_1019213 [Suillus occidentalis]
MIVTLYPQLSPSYFFHDRHALSPVISAKNLKVPSYRMPAGIYVSIKIDSRRRWKSTFKVLSSEESVAWGDTLTDPRSSHASTALSVEIRASYELGRMLGSGEVIATLETSWDELLDHGDEPFDLSFPPVRDVHPSLTLKTTLLASRRLTRGFPQRIMRAHKWTLATEQQGHGQQWSLASRLRTPVEDLKAAADILIASQYSCSAIVVPTSGQPHHVPLSVTLADLTILKDRFTRAIRQASRMIPSDSMERDHATHRQPFTSIPLHAANPFLPKADRSKEPCLEDLYICSYTPTLLALVRQPGAGKGKALLAVDSELKLVHKLVPATANRSTISGDAATRAGALQALENNTWVHLVMGSRTLHNLTIPISIVNFCIFKSCLFGGLVACLFVVRAIVPTLTARPAWTCGAVFLV